MSLTNELRCRVAVYTRRAAQTALRDTTFAYEQTGTVWAHIQPLVSQGANRDRYPGGMEEPYVKHLFTVRAGAIAQPGTDMYFLYRDVRYFVDYWKPHYLHPDRVEFYCTMELPARLTDEEAGDVHGSFFSLF